VDEVLLAPSERAVIDVLFDTPGGVRLEHRTPDHVYDLGGFTVGEASGGKAAASFEVLRTDPDLTAEHHSIGHDLERSPDKVLTFFSRMPLLYGADAVQASSYVCPMHPEVTSAEPAKCPQCGMKMVAVTAPAPSPTSYACPMHPEIIVSEPAKCPQCGMRLVPSDTPVPPTSQLAEGAEHGGHEHGDGLEWEDL
jgi:Heavy metal binding domain